MKSIKHILLTFDYEPFLGARTGSVKKCLIEPTNHLKKILDIHHAKAIFFVDTLYIQELRKRNELKQDYLIRFDDDDVFSQTILSDIEKLPLTYDCYFDEYHTYVDSVYLKLSQIKNFWIANTAIHKYEHATTVCGRANLPLLIQDHSEYWHFYYRDKNIYKAKRSNPIYYRILTPFSITSSKSLEAGSVDWKKHLQYLKGYGPWVSLNHSFRFYLDFKTFSNTYFQMKPIIKSSYWIFNKLKYLKNNLFNS